MYGDKLIVWATDSNASYYTQYNCRMTPKEWAPTSDLVQIFAATGLPVFTHYYFFCQKHDVRNRSPRSNIAKGPGFYNNWKSQDCRLHTWQSYNFFQCIRHIFIKNIAYGQLKKLFFRKMRNVQPIVIFNQYY